METWACLQLQPGYDDTIKPMRVSFDKIRYEPRPWIYYLVTQLIVPFCGDTKLKKLGFIAERSGSLK